MTGGSGKASRSADGSGQDPRLTETVARMLEARSLTDVEDSLLSPLARLVDADTATMLDFRQDQRGTIDLERSWTYNLPSSCASSYSSRFVRTDPMVSRHLRKGIARKTHGNAIEVFPVNDLASLLQEDGDRDTETYLKEFWQAFEFERLLTIAYWHPELPNHGIVIGLHRMAGSSPFDANCVERAQSIAPAIDAVLGKALLTEEVQRERLIRRALAARLTGMGLALVDKRQKVVFSNDAAERHWVGAAGTLSAENVGDPLVLPQDGRPRRRSGLEFMHHKVDRQHGLIVSAPVTATAAIACRAQGYGLSDREIEVTMLVCEGLANPEIAEALSISVRTVENHLRAIFEKVGAENRMRLMRILLGH